MRKDPDVDKELTNIDKFPKDVFKSVVKLSRIENQNQISDQIPNQISNQRYQN